MVYDGCNYFAFWAIFCPFTPLTARKINILKKWRKAPGDIIVLHKCTKNYDQMMYSSWDMVHDDDGDWCNCYFSFWAIFCPFTPLTTQKIKVLKKWKKNPIILSFFDICAPKIMIRWCMVPDICCATDRRTDRQTDGWRDRWTDGREKWHIDVGRDWFRSISTSVHQFWGHRIWAPKFNHSCAKK